MLSECLPGLEIFHTSWFASMPSLCNLTMLSFPVFSIDFFSRYIYNWLYVGCGIRCQGHPRGIDYFLGLHNQTFTVFMTFSKIKHYLEMVRVRVFARSFSH